MSTAAILNDLNEAQRIVVQHVDGPILTLAGPGSGKTRVVTHRIANLLNQGVSPYQILALTFTNKAANEMRHRLQKLVGDQPVWMGTFHGYCARFLRRYGRMIGLTEKFSIFDVADAKATLKRAIELSGVQLTHLSIDHLAREISRWKNRLVQMDELHQETRNALFHTVAKVFPCYQKCLLSSNAADFDDLLYHTAMLLRANEELRAEMDAKHRFILVDEYQDTNLAQYVIVRSLSHDHPNLNVTGDPDQSIYGWRGATIENILKFERDYPNAKVVRLETNYRSTPEILTLADTLIQNNRRRKAKSLIPARSSGDRASLRIFPSDRDEADFIGRYILREIVDHGKSPRDFAILYRTNAQSRLIEQSLMANRIQFQLIGGFRFYERQEVKDLLAYLRLIHNPSDTMAFARVIQTPSRGIGEKTLNEALQFSESRRLGPVEGLQTMLDEGRLKGRAAKGAREFLTFFVLCLQRTDGSLADLLRFIIRQTDYLQYLAMKKSERDDESLVENVNELLADAENADQSLPEEDRLEQFLEKVTLMSDTDQWEPGCDRVTLMTLHSSKGLEFRQVFIIAVEEDVLPHIRSRDDANQLEEERRLFFVGITRAMDKLHLSFAKYRGFMQRMCVPSSFLMELPRSELEWRDRTDIGSDGEESLIEDDSLVQRKKTKKELRYDLEEVGLEESQPSDGEIAEKLRSSVREARKKQRVQIGTAAGLAENHSSTNLGVGSMVRHPIYGIGRVLKVDGRGLKQIARIEFDDEQIRSFHVAKAPLERVE